MLPARLRELSRLTIANRQQHLFFLLPLIIILGLFVVLPVVLTIWNSLWQDVVFLPHRFAGLHNYLVLFKNPQFWTALGFTTAFPFVSVILELIVGTMIAVILNEKIAPSGFYRSVALLPWAIPTVIGARIFQMVFRYEFGLANRIFNILGIESINWLGSPIGAFFVLLTADLWRTTPFVAIIVLAGLQTIPRELYQQARIDGAGVWHRFISITLPLVKPAIIVAFLFRMIDALRIFDLIYILTSGGPGGATSSLSFIGYRFFLAGDFGMGSTASIIIFVIAFTLAIITVRLGRFWENII